MKENGITYWLDAEQTNYEEGCDFENIEAAIKSSKIVLSLLTHKYILSIGCRKEIDLAASKPILPIVLGANMKYPPAGPMSTVINNKTKCLKLKHKEELSEFMNEFLESVRTKLTPNIIDNNPFNHIEQSG